MGEIDAKEKLSGILLRPNERAFGIAVLYIVYRTIEANDNITLNKLKRLLNSDLLLKDEVIEGAVASLSSRSLFNVVNKWIKPSANDVIHLRVHREITPEFNSWLLATLADYPELNAFQSPTLS